MNEVSGEEVGEEQNQSFYDHVRKIPKTDTSRCDSGAKELSEWRRGEKRQLNIWGVNQTEKGRQDHETIYKNQKGWSGYASLRTRQRKEIGL